MSIGNGKSVKNATVDDILATGLRFQRGRLVVTLADAREVSLPLAWYPSLERASSRQRNRWRLIGRGLGIHWPDLDLDLSVAGLVNGFREAIPRPPTLRPKSLGRPLRKSA